MATGRQTLTLNAPGIYRIRHQWSDTVHKSLEDKLGEVVMAIEGAPDRISEERQARHPRELQEARESLARRRHNDRIWLAHERAEVVEKLASELDRASEIRSFVAAINNEEHAPPTAKRLARLQGGRSPTLD